MRGRGAPLISAGGKYYLLIGGHIGKTEKIVSNTAQAGENLCERCDDEVFSMATTEKKKVRVSPRELS